ncbi:MAG: hypothetical protein H7145_09875 [Akkermansiaceae bacterium]|nr:hypothetical protein [Armatimonadota bacterium]
MRNCTNANIAAGLTLLSLAGGTPAVAETIFEYEANDSPEQANCLCFVLFVGPVRE